MVPIKGHGGPEMQPMTPTRQMKAAELETGPATRFQDREDPDRARILAATATPEGVSRRTTAGLVLTPPRELLLSNVPDDSPK